MDKAAKFKDLMTQMSIVKDEKRICIENQDYGSAAIVRDREKKINEELDDLVGIKGFYRNLYKLEKVNYHLEQLSLSLRGIKEYYSDIDGEIFDIVDKDKYTKALRVSLEMQKKAFSDLTNFRNNTLGDITGKKFDEGLGF
jgi:hypothetical protein